MGLKWQQSSSQSTSEICREPQFYINLAVSFQELLSAVQPTEGNPFVQDGKVDASGLRPNCQPQIFSTTVRPGV